MTGRVDPDQVRTVACVGAGVIGGGWVAYFLARGFRVRAWDPAPDAEARLRAIVEAAWPALTELGLGPRARALDNLTVDAELAAAVGRRPTSCRRAPRSSWTSSAACSPTSPRPPRSTSSSAPPPRASG